MNKIIQQSLPMLPIELCNIIHQYSKLPFADELPKTSKWSNCEEEWGIELTELIVDYKVNIHTHTYLKLFGYFDYNPNLDFICPYLKDTSMSVTKKLFAIKNILVYNCDLMCIPISEELDRVHNYKPSDNTILKEMCRNNKIRVQHNSRTKTLVKKLMKL